MPSLILHPTPIAQWQTLLYEAQKKSSIHLKEDLEAYLVFLLMRFMQDPSVATSVLGLEFLNSYHHLNEQQHQLKEVGDKCLLFAGLFPGRAVKRRVKLSYFVKLGQMAYSTFSNYQLSDEGLFISLGEEFPKLMDVLQATRHESFQTFTLLESLELWHETHSPSAWNRLCNATKSLPGPINTKSH